MDAARAQSDVPDAMEASTAAPMSGPAVAERLVLDEPLRERLIEIAAHRFRLDRETAEDLLQETAIELVRSAGLIQKPDGFAYRVFYTRCCHYLDRETGRRALRERAGPPTALPHTGEADALDLGITLRQALAQVSPACRKLLYFRYIEGRSLEETAHALDKAGSGVSTLISRCLSKLRRLVSCEAS